MNPNPHKRKKRRTGDSTGMKGFSEGAAEGLGLSDAGQRVYNAAQRSNLSSGYDKYLFDVKTMLIPGTNTLRGMYQLPGSPEYAGGKGDVPFISDLLGIGGVAASSRSYVKSASNTMGNRVASQPGGMGWFRRGSALGAPPAEAKTEARSIFALGGLAYIALKVLS